MILAFPLPMVGFFRGKSHSRRSNRIGSWCSQVCCRQDAIIKPAFIFVIVKVNEITIHNRSRSIFSVCYRYQLEDYGLGAHVLDTLQVDVNCSLAEHVCVMWIKLTAEAMAKKNLERTCFSGAFFEPVSTCFF